jgi:hypothetical protein
MDGIARAASGRWIRDTRGPARVLRVSAHPAAGFLVLSTWREGQCVGTVRLTPSETVALMAELVSGLAGLASPTHDTPHRAGGQPG